MKKKYFSLDLKETAKWAEWVQIAFGIICIIISIMLTIYILKSDAFKKSTWPGICFLVIFGFFQIWSGLGFAKKFIEIGIATIKLKRNSIGPTKEIKAADIERIESFPLNTIFRLKDSSHINLRFGVNYPEQIAVIVEELSLFAEENKLIFEHKDDII
jgi:hypothetical protein